MVSCKHHILKGGGFDPKTLLDPGTRGWGFQLPSVLLNEIIKNIALFIL